MSDLSAFAELVVSDVRNEADAAAAASLRDPNLYDAWQEELVNLLNKIDSQISRSKAEHAKKLDEYNKYLKESKTWRGNALVFRRAAFDRLMEVKRLRREQAELNANPDALQAEVIKLRSAIQHHRDAALNAHAQDADLDEAADEMLWSVLG